MCFAQRRPYLEVVPMSEIKNHVMINIIDIFDSLNQFFLYVFFRDSENPFFPRTKLNKQHRSKSRFSRRPNLKVNSVLESKQPWKNIAWLW